MLLFDEIEKAHPDIFNILLQILDDGRLTDAQGRTVDFKHTVVIMTSNLGADRIQEQARTGESFEELKEDLMQILRGSFRPEFINRIDEIIVFHALSEEQLLDITRLLLDRLARRLHAQRIDVVFTDEAVRLPRARGIRPRVRRAPVAADDHSDSWRTSSRGSCSAETSSPATGWRSRSRTAQLRFDVEKGVFERASEDEKVGAGVSE